MNVVSLFSGIGGFDLGFERCGLHTVLQCEWDAGCRELLADRWPGAIRIPDVRSIAAAWKRLQHGQPVNHDYWKPIFERLRTATVWCGGFPCQDLSVAGARAGLAGERSGLWFTFRRLIGLFRPAWVVIENVPGLLSSNGGRDLAIILSGLAKLGYRWSYRVLDAQYFGLAQRRERVFIVASRGNFGCAEVLFEPESLCWDSPPSREKREEVTHSVASRIGGSGRGFDRAGERRGQDPAVACFGGNNTSGPIQQATACNAHGGAGRFDFESETFVTHTPKSEGADVSKDGTGRGVPLIAFTERSRADGRNFEAQEECSYALTNPGYGGRTHSRQIATQTAVRRLTPTEFERLQGFPDRWTESLGADSPRYRALGNAVAVPVVEWIGRRMVAVINWNQPSPNTEEA